ncbi:hypothetical protein GGI43DRAFT_238950 [Trichoderma evansii]
MIEMKSHILASHLKEATITFCTVECLFYFPFNFYFGYFHTLLHAHQNRAHSKFECQRSSYIHFIFVFHSMYPSCFIITLSTRFFFLSHSFLSCLSCLHAKA